MNRPDFSKLTPEERQAIKENAQQFEAGLARIRAARAKLIKTRTENSPHSSAKAPPVDFYSKTVSQPQSENQNVRKPYKD